MDAPSFDVIVCGSLHLDIMLFAPTLPRPDETVVGSRWERRCGGKGGNQAVMAARAGARTAMIGRVGADEFGERLRENLLDAGVDAGAVSVDPAAGSGMSAAIVREDGEYGAVIVSGANLRIEPSAAARQWEDLGGAKALILQNEIPESVNVAAALAARATGALVVLNAAPARGISPALLDLVDVLVVNRIEAEMLGAGAVGDVPSAIGALAALKDLRRSVIVTLGGDGLAVRSGDAAPEAIAPRRVKVISSHGAGDCFVGALAAALARGASLMEAAGFANAAAAAHVSDPNRTETLVKAG